MACSGPLEPANSARRGHARTVPHAKMSSMGRTELKISLSRAKNVKEPAGDVRFCAFPQKTNKHAKKLIFSTHFPKCSGRVQTHPNASGCIRTHPNASERIRTGPSKTENLEKLAKTSKNLRKTREMFAKIFAIACFSNFRPKKWPLSMHLMYVSLWPE